MELWDGGGGLSASIDSITSRERAYVLVEACECFSVGRISKQFQQEKLHGVRAKACQPIDRARPWQGHVKSKANRADDDDYDDAGSTL